MIYLVPSPFKRIVSSLVIVTFLATPNVASMSSALYPFLSKYTPASSATNCPPVKMAISCIVALRLSPNEGAFTTQILRLLLSLLMIRLARI